MVRSSNFKSAPSKFWSASLFYVMCEVKSFLAGRAVPASSGLKKVLESLDSTASVIFARPSCETLVIGFFYCSNS